MDEKDTKNIEATMIIEVLGRPPEHLVETLNNIINSIDKENGVKVLSKKINEPVLLKDRNDFYTSFAEIDVKVNHITHIAMLVFKYMPAHIEIVYPEFIALQNASWNEVFNELARKLHGYDEVARIIQVEKKILENKLREVMEKQKAFEDNSKSTEDKPKKAKKKKEKDEEVAE